MKKKAIIAVVIVVLVILGARYYNLTKYYIQDGVIADVYFEVDSRNCTIYIENNRAENVLIKGLHEDMLDDSKEAMEIHVISGAGVEMNLCLCNFIIFSDSGEEAGRGSICENEAEEWAEKLNK